MKRDKARVLVVGLALLFSLSMSAANPIEVDAAVACTSSSPGWSTKTMLNTWFAPNGSQQQGSLWGRDCNDGTGVSVKWRSLSTSRWLQGGGGPYVIDWVYVWLDATDDCSVWDDFGPNGIANTWTNQYNTVWHWQPSFVCGPVGIYNEKTDAGGQMKEAGQFDHSWVIHWQWP